MTAEEWNKRQEENKARIAVAQARKDFQAIIDEWVDAVIEASRKDNAPKYDNEPRFFGGYMSDDFRTHTPELIAEHKAMNGYIKMIDEWVAAVITASERDNPKFAARYTTRDEYEREMRELFPDGEY